MKSRRLRLTLYKMQISALNVALGVLLILLIAPPSTAEVVQQDKELVDRARNTLDTFLHDPAISDFAGSVKDAKGILIFPQVVTLAAGIGVEGGNGVLLIQDEQTREWIGPAFYTLSRAGIGLQGGVEVSEIIFLLTSAKSVKAILSGTATLVWTFLRLSPPVHAQRSPPPQTSASISWASREP